MSPAGWTQKISNRCPQGGSRTQVAEQRLPSGELNPENVIALHRLYQTVAAVQVGTLGDIGAKQAVEHDEHAAVVAIEVFDVSRMVHAVRRRGIQHPLQWPQARNPSGVYPELVQEVQRQQ